MRLSVNMIVLGKCGERGVESAWFTCGQEQEVELQIP